MSERLEQVRVRVVTDNVILSKISAPVPKGEYDGYIDWQNAADGERHMTAVQLILDPTALAEMGHPEGIPSMQCEVLQYLRVGLEMIPFGVKPLRCVG
jgi:hypothetical protein